MNTTTIQTENAGEGASTKPLDKCRAAARTQTSNNSIRADAFFMPPSLPSLRGFTKYIQHFEWHHAAQCPLRSRWGLPHETNFSSIRRRAAVHPERPIRSI